MDANISRESNVAVFQLIKKIRTGNTSKKKLLMVNMLWKFHVRAVECSVGQTAPQFDFKILVSDTRAFNESDC